ncbi:hypothetical protein AB0K40_43315 [Nonomuraea bangladeshensis]|uniref:Uncharacterized protein n=1 Tax=Nonomuraea bangladeshensis TaxID=404385 RepID=A0ABV3HIL6_9ACTN
MAAPPDARGVLEDHTVVERSCDEPDLFALLYDRYFGDLYRSAVLTSGPTDTPPTASWPAPGRADLFRLATKRGAR